jgi:hypothetical protein
MFMIRKLLLLGWLALCPVPSFAEQTLHERLAAALDQQDKAAAARLTRQAVRDASQLDWDTLYSAAQGAVFAERIADAHFLYQAAQMRARIELAAFPPIDPRGIASLMDDPHLRASAVIDPLMVSHSKDFIDAAKRLDKWQPAYPRNYKPDWFFDVARGTDLRLAVARVKAEHLARLADLSWLLGNEKYLQALRTHQAFLMASDEEQAISKRKSENARAEQFMLDMEKASGREGFMRLR